MTFAYDTSCIVALLTHSHQRHAATLADFERRQKRKHTLVVVPHTLLESYAVLTGSPPPQRLNPAHAMRALESFVALAHPAPAVTVNLAFELMKRTLEAGRPGGAIYDAHIVQMAQMAGAREVVTWNLKHFLPFATPSIRAVTPKLE